MAKINVFIDGTWLYSNLRHLAKESNLPGFHIDYGILPRAIANELAEKNGLGHLELVRTFLFGSYPINYNLMDEDRARKRKDFFTMLREDYHYDVEAFPIDYAERRILHDDREADDPFSPREKCVDIALASTMLYYASIPSAFDIAVAVVGDKDYFPLFQKVRQLGKRVAIISIRQSCAKMYSDRQDPKKLKDFHIIWLNDMIQKIAWTPVEVSVECRSPLHEGSRMTTTTMRLRNGQPYFCDVCRAKFAEQKEEQMREYTSAGVVGGTPKVAEAEETPYFDGQVEALIPERGFGFIKRGDGASFFFHLTHLANAEWELVNVGDKVRFTVTKNPVGAKAGAAADVNLVFDGDKAGVIRR
ncbi:MAG: NYN domain-containing protein [Nitrospinota bacterium]|nr:NYN domain-containing protein [Nitrospinota bacterium]